MGTDLFLFCTLFVLAIFYTYNNSLIPEFPNLA